MLLSVGAAGSAAVITVTGIHPIDVVKTRLQVAGKDAVGGRDYKSLGAFGSVKVIAKEEGVSAFWKGINAAWMREASYTSLRLGLYSPIKSAMGVTNDSHFLLKFVAGSSAGALGSLVGNPFDVLKTRLMSMEGTASITAASKDLFQSEGAKGFYRGLQANIMRAMVLNGTKMAVFDTAKQRVTESGLVPAGLATSFVSAFTAGFFMAITVTPFDMIRTRLMNQPPGAKIYTGFVDCGVKIVRANGPMGLYSGFFPIWARFAPTTTLQLVIFEQIKPMFGLDH